MRCAICDKDDDMIVFDKVREEFTPCPECQAIIEETLRELEDPDES